MSQEETTDEMDGEIEANSPELWSLIGESEETNCVLDEASRLMKAFDTWILERGLQPDGHNTIFCEQIQGNVPECICMWVPPIALECYRWLSS